MTTKFEKIHIFNLTDFLLNDKLKLTEKMKKHIKALKAEGHGLGIITSRSYTGVQVAIPKEIIELFDLIVAHNGASIYFEGQVEDNRIPIQEVRDFVDEDSYRLVTVQFGVIYGETPKSLQKIADAWGVPKIPQKSLDDLQNDAFSLTLYFDFKYERDVALEKLKNKVNLANFHLTKVKDKYIVVTAEGASRVAALRKHLMGQEIIYYASSYEDIDVYNDKRLNIKKIALPNAIDEIKALADEVMSQEELDSYR